MMMTDEQRKLLDQKANQQGVNLLGTDNQPKETPEPYKQDAIEDGIDSATRIGGNILGASADAALAAGATKFLAPRLLGAAGTALGSSAVLPIAAAGYTAYQAGKAIDKEFDISGKAANIISGPAAPQQDGDLRRDVMKRGLDINNPIMKQPNARRGSQDYGVVSGYGELDITPGKENMYNLGPQHSMYDPNRAPAPAATPDAAPVAAPVAPGQPNLSAVPGAPDDAAAPVDQPNLAAVQTVAPQGPQKGDLIGSYLGRDGSNIGMFEGMPNAPITAEQLAGLENTMDAGGMPVVSGTKAPGLVRAMDNMGNIQFANPEQANAMNATMGETIRAEKEAQQRAINSDYMRERGNAAIRNMQANAPINYYDQASRQAQESIANRPDFSRAFSGVGSG